MLPPLHEALRSGKEELAVSRLEDGASPRDRSRGWAPIHTAALQGMVEATKMLLRMGADKDAMLNYAFTPLDVAARCNHAPVIRVLLEAGANTTHHGVRGWTPMIIAVCPNIRPNTTAKESREVVETMIELGVDVNEPSCSGATPLHYASNTEDCCSVDMIDVLVAAGANVNAQDKRGETPLHWAATPKPHGPRNAADWNTMVDIVDFLLKAGADENVLDNSGKTALMRSMEPCRGDALYQCARVRELLANAPADRADRRWRRRALLVMCIARHRRGEAQLRDDAGGGASDDWTRVAEWMLGAVLEGGTAVGGVFGTIVMYLLVMCIARQGEAQLRDSAAVRASDDWTRVAVWRGAGLEGGAGGVFGTIVMYLLVMCIARHRREEAQLRDGAAASPSDDLTRVAVWMLGDGLEGGAGGVFRTIVMYL